MKRFLSFLLLFVLFWSTWPGKPRYTKEKKTDICIVLSTGAEAVSETTARSVKQAASLIFEGLTVSHPCRSVFFTAWSPIVGSLILSCFLRHPFYTAISINAP